MTRDKQFSPPEFGLTDDEDARILAAAKADPDAQPVDFSNLVPLSKEEQAAKRERFKKSAEKGPKTVRIAPDVSAHFQKDGVDLETSINSALRRVMEEG
ncbi:MAG: BrnA antitoxin family protein [Pseudomonadota bacterium]